MEGLNNKMDLLLKEFLGVKSEISNVKEQVTGINGKLDTVLTDVGLLKSEVEQVKADYASLSSTVAFIDNRIDYLENQSRRNNIIFRNIPEEKGEKWADSKSKIIKVIKDKLGMEVSSFEIERAHRTAGKSGARPMVVKFLSYDTRERVFSLKKKLAGSDIGMDEDFSPQVREQRIRLVEKMKEAKKLGFFAKLSFNKLIVENASCRETFMVDPKSENVVRVTSVGVTKRGRGNPADVVTWENPLNEASVTEEQAGGNHYVQHPGNSTAQGPVRMDM